MNILIVGAGVVGTATGKGFHRLGHCVTFADSSLARLGELSKEGFQVFFDPESAYLPGKDIIFFCVPETAIEEAVTKWNTGALKHEGLMVIRSTVPPGTTAALQFKIRRSVTPTHISFNPEFLREAVAEYEFLNPPGVVIGECCRKHGDMLKKLYAPLRVPIHRVTTTTAELLKMTVNSYLACQISFWNQIKAVADNIGVNSHQLGMLASFCDSRVSSYGARMHGEPYGGKCLPKDLAQMLKLCQEREIKASLLEAVKEINEGVRT